MITLRQRLFFISAACHALRHFYILFLTTINGAMQVSSMRWVSLFKVERVGVQLRLGTRPRHFFFKSFSPSTCSLFISLFIFLFISLFIYFPPRCFKCFPFIIFLNINSPIFIIRKPTLFLCSFHNNDNKCFVGYF